MLDPTNLDIFELVISWLISHGVQILFILIALILIKSFSSFFVEKLVRRTVPPGHSPLSAEAEKKRENTLIHVINRTVSVLVWIIGALMILSEAGLDVAPLLAAAGVAGIAFGFGGQYLIKDIITGLFILYENQYRVGDVVCVGDICGSVEDINLRLTVLRDLDGTVHHIPNGEIKTASNLTKTFSRVNLDVGVSYNANLEHVIEVVNKVGQDLANDPAWKEKIISTPEFLRVNEFADSSVVIKILGDTVASAQWDVSGELRKRLKIAFDDEGIEIPFPQRTVHMPQTNTKSA